MNSSLMSLRLSELFGLARSKNASDLHIAPGDAPVLRIDGALERSGNPLSVADCDALALQLFDETQMLRLAHSGDLTISWRDPELGSFRIHAYRTMRGISYSVRLLALSIPPIESLRLPASVTDFAMHRHGLIIFAGPTGSGKSTALAALADSINRKERKHIITIEDPIEYEHVARRSVINQREIGRDASSFSNALQGALRSDPDVILLGEMRDAETMRAALTAAETGHLVFATLHTGNAPQTIDRIIDAFASDAQSQIRAQLAQTLLAVVCLRLIPRADGAGRLAAAEVMIASDAVRNLIREQKTHQIYNAISTARQLGMQTLEAHLSELVMRRQITLAAAHAACSRPGDLRVSEGSGT